MTKFQKALKKLVESLYTTPEGEPIHLYPTQVRIIESIFDEKYKRVVIGTPTQYGKSLSVAIGSLLYLKKNIKKVQIIAPTEGQANIIMEYVRYFVSIRPELLSGLMGVSSVEQLRTQRNRGKLQWSDGSAIGVQSADAGKNSTDIEKAGKRIMGFGGDLIVIDETALIPDLIIGKILRMLGKSKDSKLVLLGNPFTKNYFYKAANDKNFYKIWIDAQDAVKEGRYTQEYIDEMRKSMDVELYQILYECKFILGGTKSYIRQQDIDSGLAILNRNKKDERWVELQKKEGVNFGVDVASGSGGDNSVIYIRQGYKTLEIIKDKYVNTQQLALLIASLARKYNPQNVNVDLIGVGHGVVDRLQEMGIDANGVNVGGEPTAKERYYNIRMELWAKLRQAIINGNLELPDDNELLEELLSPQREFKNSKSGVVEILEPKEQIKQRLGRSPDTADALALTFFEGGNFVFGII